MAEAAQVASRKPAPGLARRVSAQHRRRTRAPGHEQRRGGPGCSSRFRVACASPVVRPASDVPPTRYPGATVGPDCREGGVAARGADETSPPNEHNPNGLVPAARPRYRRLRTGARAPSGREASCGPESHHASTEFVRRFRRAERASGRLAN